MSREKVRPVYQLYSIDNNFLLTAPFWNYRMATHKKFSIMNAHWLSIIAFKGVQMTVGRSIAFIDLDTRTVDITPVPEKWRGSFVGGRGVGTYLACRHGDAGSDPFSAGNAVVISAGLLGGTLSSPNPLAYITTKSPLTGFLETTPLSGLFAAEMRWAGFDHLVITGRSRRWVTLDVHNRDIRILNTGHLKGEGVFDASEALRQAQGDADLKTIAIGPAGENRVRFATIVDGAGNSAGRTGMGAVLGFKRVKALACRGSLDLEIKFPEEAIRQRLLSVETARSAETGQSGEGLTSTDYPAGSGPEELDSDRLNRMLNDWGMDGQAAILMATLASRHPSDDITVLLERIALRKGRIGASAEGPLRTKSKIVPALSQICLCQEGASVETTGRSAPEFTAPPASSSQYRGKPGLVSHLELSNRLLDSLGDRTAVGICRRTGRLDLDRAAELIRFNTGLDLTSRTMEAAAYRCYALERLFNLKAARAARQAGILDSCLEAPGGIEMSLSAWESIDLDTFRKMVARHYRTNGWDRKNLLKKKVFEHLEVAELWNILK